MNVEGPTEATIAARIPGPEAREGELSLAWSLPPEAPLCGKRDVHVWRASLDRGTVAVEALRETLSEDERDRADRFFFSRDRDHFIVARGLLRAILGLYLRREPAELRFRYGAQGKPDLEGAQKDGELRFNLSHSRTMALYAVAEGRRVGIDIEHVRPDFAGEEIAARFFSRAEIAALRRVPAPERTEAFFHCWTRKEAYIKGIGEGLSMPLDRFDVSLAPGVPARLIETRGDPEEAARWRLRALAPGPGYVAALAAEGRGWRLATWAWPGP